MKGKRSRWSYLGLLLLCFLFMGVVPMNARAEESEEVPQLTFTKKIEDLTTTDGISAKVQYEVRTLEKTDFRDEIVYNPDESG